MYTSIDSGVCVCVCVCIKLPLHDSGVHVPYHKVSVDTHNMHTFSTLA